MKCISYCGNLRDLSEFECDICHKTWKSTFNNIKNGNSCPHCSASKGERHVAKILDEHNIQYSYLLSNPARVKYLETSPWMKNEKKKELLESANSGIPVKMAVASLDGFSPLEVLRMQFLENDVLSLHENWIPLQSAYTTASGMDDTKPEKDVTELTDEGDASREKEKSDM